MSACHRDSLASASGAFLALLCQPCAFRWLAMVLTILIQLYTRASMRAFPIWARRQLTRLGLAWPSCYGGWGGVGASVCVPYRSLFFSFGYEAIAGAGQRQAVMARSLDWLTTKPLTAGLALEHLSSPTVPGCCCSFRRAEIRCSASRSFIRIAASSRRCLAARACASSVSAASVRRALARIAVPATAVTVIRHATTHPRTHHRRHRRRLSSLVDVSVI